MLQINPSSPSEIDQLRQELTEFQLVGTLSKIKAEVGVGPSCFIAYAKGIDEHEIIIHKLAKHLKAAGLRVSVDIWDRRPGTKTSDFIGRLDKSDYVILAGSKNLKEQYESYKEGQKEEQKRISFAYKLDTYIQLEQIFNKLQERSEKIIPLLLEEEMSTAFPSFLQGITPLDMQDKELYPYQFFALTERLIGKDLSPSVKEFKELQTALYSEKTSIEKLLKKIREAKEKDKALTKKAFVKFIDSFETQQAKDYYEREAYYEKGYENNNDKNAQGDEYSKESITFSQVFTRLSKERKKQLLIANFLCLSFFILLFTWKGKEAQIIRPDLSIPEESSFLNRPDLIAQMESGLENKKGIRTIALVGIEGAGKATLAHSYAKLYPSSTMDIIKADTKENLIKSFKTLAGKLAKTKEDRDNLDLIQQNRRPDQEEEQLITFVKTHLKQHSNWLLIYDNVVMFSDIETFLPDDSEVWGEGRVIITTQDGNIENFDRIKSENVISIPKLDPQESLTLFSKILHGKESTQLSKEDKKEEIVSFLSKIPPFPLDVVTAARYAKKWGFNPKRYMDQIIKYRKNSKEETYLSKEILNYKKDRYGVVTVPFKALIDEHEDFKKLLLFICVADSQDIPIAILEYYEEKGVTDNFIDTLKKYSLITTQIHTENRKEVRTLSIHRGIQSIGLDFLLDLLDKTERSSLLNELVIKTAEFCDGSTEYPPEASNLILLLPSLEVFLKNIKTPPISEGIVERDKQKLLVALGYTYYWYTNDFLKAKEHLAEALLIGAQNNSLSNEDLAEISCDLATLCADLEDLDDALKYAQESIEKCKNISASEVLQARNQFTIGSVYANRNNFKQAEKYLCDALKLMERVKDLKIKKQLESKAYAYLGWLYSETYLTHDPEHNAESYVNKSLKVLDENSSIKTVWNERRVKSTINSGEVYCRLGQYKEAAGAFKGAQEVIDNHKNGNPYNFHTIRILVGVGEVLLREGKLEAARAKLSETLTKSEKVLGSDNSWIPLPARVFRAETLIKQGNFKEAYEDCSIVLKMNRKARTNYVSLLYLIADYHAAIIKHKQNDLQKSIEHFSNFFRGVKTLCERLINKETYEDLERNAVFEEPIYQKDTAPSVIQNCLQRSTQIFTAIYGPSHPFVTNYVQIKDNFFLTIFHKWMLWWRN